jgi:gluconolactonase
MTASMTLADLIDPAAEFELLGDGFGFTEGPVWDARGERLLFNDIPGDSRWQWSEARGIELLRRPNFKGNGMVFEADGSLLICEHVSSCLVRLTPAGVTELVAFHHEGRYLNSPNDVVVRTDGTIYFTDSDYGRTSDYVGQVRPRELDFHGVFRIRPGGGETELVVARDEFDQPNGLCFSPDERKLYINDRTCLKVFAVEPDGSLSGGRTILRDMGSPEVPGNGNPDGMKCDEHGNIWCTARDGIWVISPEEELLGVVQTPEVAGNVAWAGPASRSLLVTMSTSLYRIQTNVRPVQSLPG